MPVEQGRLLASLIPGARLVVLDSENHILLADEAAWPRFLAELNAFLGGDGATPADRRWTTSARASSRCSRAWPPG